MARTGPAVAANRTTLGRRLLIRFYTVSMLISLTGVATWPGMPEGRWRGRRVPAVCFALAWMPVLTGPR